MMSCIHSLQQTSDQSEEEGETREAPRRPRVQHEGGYQRDGETRQAGLSSSAASRAFAAALFIGYDS